MAATAQFFLPFKITPGTLVLNQSGKSWVFTQEGWKVIEVQNEGLSRRERILKMFGIHKARISSIDVQIPINN